MGQSDGECVGKRGKRESEYWQRWRISSFLNWSVFLLHRRVMAVMGVCGQVDVLGEGNQAKEEAKACRVSAFMHLSYHPVSA